MVNSKTKAGGEKITQGVAIAALLLNILVLPGVGTIIGGKKQNGIIQLILFLVGFPLILLFGLGAILMLAAWIWALVDAIQILQQAENN